MIQWKNSKVITVNNIKTSAIVADAKDVLNYHSDKYIITRYKTTSGDLVIYEGLMYMIVSQIDRNYEDRKEEQYNYRARMRSINYDVKFILDEKLFLYHTIIEKESGQLVSSGEYISISTDKIIVALPLTESSKVIELGARFVSMSRCWQVEHINRTKKGLIYLTCKSSLINSTVDDMKNEIANRYVSSVDRLKGNITPILPIDPIPDLPTNPVDPVDPVDPIEPVGLTITGLSRFTIWDEDEEYSINTDKPVKWSLDRVDLIFIERVDGNKCYISSSSTSIIGESILRVEVVGEPDLFAELMIPKFYQ